MHENPNIWKPTKDFLDKFGIVISPFRFPTPKHITFIQSHSAVPWFYGIPFRTDTGLLHNPGKTRFDLNNLAKKEIRNKSKNSP